MTKVDLEKEGLGWLDPDFNVYETGDVVQNPFSGEEIELDALELSVYDLIMGAQVMGEWKLMQKGLDWFRRRNAEAYMVLLD